MRGLIAFLCCLGVSLAAVDIPTEQYTNNFINGLNQRVYRYGCNYSTEEQEKFLRAVMSFLHANDIKGYSNKKKQELLICASKNNFAIILPIMTKFYLGIDDKAQREELIAKFSKIDANILSFSNALYDIAKERYISNAEDLIDNGKEEKRMAMKKACSAFMQANENGQKVILNLTYRGQKIDKGLISQMCSYK